MSLKRCALCKKAYGYWIPTIRNPVSVCGECLKAVHEYLERMNRKSELAKMERKRQLFREALVANVLKRGSVYASSLAWRFGLPRTEAYRESMKVAKRRGWQVFKVPNNHIVVRAGGDEALAQTETA